MGLEAANGTPDAPIPSYLLAVLFVCLAEAFRLEKSLVRAMQALGHGGSDQGIVLDIEQVIYEKPNGLVGGHPVLAIEAFQIDRN